MPKVSISEAARLAGVSRQHLYKKWITPGLLSVEKDEENPPLIDTAELLRVFGELKASQPTSGVPEAPDALESEISALRRLLADRDAQLLEAREREAWLRQHIGEMTGALRLLENKGQSDQAAQQLQKARRAIQQYKEALAAERDRGFWARLFNLEG